MTLSLSVNVEQIYISWCLFDQFLGEESVFSTHGVLWAAFIIMTSQMVAEVSATQNHKALHKSSVYPITTDCFQMYVSTRLKISVARSERTKTLWDLRISCFNPSSPRELVLFFTSATGAALYLPWL